LSTEEITTPAPILKKDYHYIVIDIKFSTLPLRADGVHILNSGSYPAYKAQCLVYTEAVGLIQGFTAPYSFIMGRRWKCNKKGVENYNQTCLNKLGKISYNSVDLDYKQRTNEAIQWVRDVKNIGHTWTINPPSRIELYPNMCVDSGKWNYEKEKISNNIGEITNIWYVGLKQRNIAIKKGIKTWKDRRCSSQKMNINGASTLFACSTPPFEEGFFWPAPGLGHAFLRVVRQNHGFFTGYGCLAEIWRRPAVICGYLATDKRRAS
jgi:hypothetical protein